MGDLANTLRDAFDQKMESIIGPAYSDLDGAIKNGLFTALAEALEEHADVLVIGGGGIKDASPTSPSVGDIIIFDGSNWVSSSAPEVIDPVTNPFLLAMR